MPSAVILRRTFRVGSIPGITNSEKELGQLRDWYAELERSVPGHTEERKVLEGFWNKHRLDKED